MSTDVLRLLVGIMAMLVVGGALVTAARYAVSAVRLGRTPGRILARHVAEVATGTAGLSFGYAVAVLEQLGGATLLSADARLVLYLISMSLLLIGLVEVAIYQTARARSYPQRQAQVRDAIRSAIDRHRVTGPRSADHAAVLAANAVLELEGTPTLAAPETPARTREQPAADDTDATPATGHGRHALTRDRRVP